MFDDECPVSVPSDDTPVEPALFVLSPLQGPAAVGPPGPDVCLAAGFRPKGAELVLNLGGGQLNKSTAGAVVSRVSKTFFYAGFSNDNDTIHSCELRDRAGNNEQLDLCADVRPDVAQLNFFLLLMNGVRLIFTKMLAFSTVLTVRALLP